MKITINIEKNSVIVCLSIVTFIKKHDGGEFGHKTMVDILESSNVLILPKN